MNPRAALPLLDVRVPEVYERLDSTSAHDFLTRIRFPEAAHHWRSRCSRAASSPTRANSPRRSWS